MGVQDQAGRRRKDRSYQSEACGMRERAGLWCRLRLDICCGDGIENGEGHTGICLTLGSTSNIPNAYVKACKEEHLKNFLAIQ